MNNMFGLCSSLKELDLSSFNTQNVEKMDYMFTSCDGLTKINLSSFDVSKADINSMFYETPNLKKEGVKKKEKRIIDEFTRTNKDN